MKDKFRDSIKKAYRSSPLYKLDRLIAEESKWKRRQTIADNKLADIRFKINFMAKNIVSQGMLK